MEKSKSSLEQLAGEELTAVSGGGYVNVYSNRKHYSGANVNSFPQKAKYKKPNKKG